MVNSEFLKNMVAPPLWNELPHKANFYLAWFGQPLEYIQFFVIKKPKLTGGTGGYGCKESKNLLFYFTSKFFYLRTWKDSLTFLLPYRSISLSSCRLIPINRRLLLIALELYIKFGGLSKSGQNKNNLIAHMILRKNQSEFGFAKKSKLLKKFGFQNLKNRVPKPRGRGGGVTHVFSEPSTSRCHRGLKIFLVKETCIRRVQKNFFGRKIISGHFIRRWSWNNFIFYGTFKMWKSQFFHQNEFPLSPWFFAPIGRLWAHLKSIEFKF